MSILGCGYMLDWLLEFNLYLHKCLWSTCHLYSRSAYLLFVLCNVFGLSHWQWDIAWELFLIHVKPELHCTSLARVVPLFIGVGNNHWVTFAIELIDNYMSSNAYLTASELMCFRPKPNTWGGPNLTTDWIQSLLLIAYGCKWVTDSTTSVIQWNLYASIAYNRLIYKATLHKTGSKK